MSRPQASLPNERAETLEQALTEIKQWCDAYPTTIFRPISDERLKIADGALRAVGVDMGALHASWARHLLDGIGKIATDALGRCCHDP